MDYSEIAQARKLLAQWEEASGDAGSDDAEHEVGGDMASFLERMIKRGDNAPQKEDGKSGDFPFDVEIVGVIRVEGMTRTEAWDRVRSIDSYPIDTFLGPELNVKLTEISVSKAEMFED